MANAAGPVEVLAVTQAKPVMHASMTDTNSIVLCIRIIEVDQVAIGYQVYSLLSVAA